MSKVLVTGANGFLAYNIIIELLTRGYTVRGMLRKTARMMINHPNLELFYGKITREEDVVNATEGCQIVIHNAAVTDPAISDHHVYVKINVGGTKNIIKASIEKNVNKVIYISSANSFGYGSKKFPGHEGSPMQFPFTSSGYARSKAAAQEMILNSFKGTAVEIVVINPTFMIGPNDFKESSNRIILRALGKRILLIPPGGKNFVHVTDVATAIGNSIKLGKNGECYIVANENLSYRELYNKMAGVTKSKIFLLTVPIPLLLLAGLAGNIMRYIGLNTAINLTNMQILCIGSYYSADKAIKTIEIQQTPIVKAIEETISWFKRI